MTSFVFQGQRRVCFHTFMQRALYHPAHGYYRSSKVRQGRRGDYLTSPSMGPLFSQCIANYIVPLLLQNPTWSIAEIGPGTGDLACNLLQALARHSDLSRNYYLVEPGQNPRAGQSQRISEIPSSLHKLIQWSDQLPKDFRGVVIANEVLDALPVHLLETCSENHLRSLHVELAGGQVQWAYTAPDSRVSAALQQRGINLYPNYRYEISLDIKPFLYDLYQKMDSGICLFFDYGYSRTEYYHPYRKSGTLTAYFDHHRSNDILDQPGEQDISCHVDFNLVTDEASACGFIISEFCTQELFLHQNGIVQALHDQLHCLDSLDYQRLRQSAHILTSPQEMGALIKAICLSKSN